MTVATDKESMLENVKQVMAFIEKNGADQLIIIARSGEETCFVLSNVSGYSFEMRMKEAASYMVEAAGKSQ